MKTVILCGGLGTRLAEETQVKPKPMVDVGGKPILWHIMKIYNQFGYKDFVLLLGYKSEVIKEYFLNFRAMSGDLSVNLANGAVNYIESKSENWKIDLIDTGLNTLTGGRLKRLEHRLRPHGTFMLTYGDGVADVDVNKLVAFHRSHGKLATVTAVRPSGRFGVMKFAGDKVSSFAEKAQTDTGWINGGFFVFEPEIFDYLTDDMTILERDPLERLAEDGQLHAYKHDGFWHCMDTLRDKQFLNKMVDTGNTPWLSIENSSLISQRKKEIA